MAMRYTRLPRPTAIAARYGNHGTPTTPEAQVNTFIGIGANPPATSSQNTAHGDSAIFALIVSMPDSMPPNMPIASNSGLSNSKA